MNYEHGNGSHCVVVQGAVVQCTEGWECDLGIWGLNFFFANNGLGAFLGPNWKVFHHGTLRNHFQGVVIAFGSHPVGVKRAEMG